MSVGAFHRSLRSRGVGAKSWSNSFTEHEYLGVNEDGKHSYGVNLSVGHRVFKDKKDAKWKKHKLTDQRPTKDYILVQSAKCCVEIYPTYAKYFDVHHEEVRLHEERWVVQRLFKEPDDWRDVGAWNPVVAVEEGADFIKVTVTYETDYGPFTVEYLQRDGSALKHNVYFTNTSGGEETFRVLQKWAGIIGAKVNGKDFPVDIETSFLAFHRADQPQRKFNISENLWSMIFNPDGSEKTDQCLQTPIKIESHAQGMKADFIYGNWTLAQGELLEIDPDTATLSDPTLDGNITHRDAIYTREYTGDDITFGKVDIMGTTSILRGFVEWSILGIPDGSTITKTEFRYHGHMHNVNATNADIRAMASQPSAQPNNAAGNQVIYDDAGDGTAYLSNDAVFSEVGATKDVGGASGPAWDADPSSDVQTALAVDWFAIGMKTQESESPGSNDDWAYDIYSEDYVGPPTPPPTLYLEYTLGWTGKISGVVNPASIMGIPVADIVTVKGIA